MANLPSFVVELLNKRGQIATITTERAMKTRKGQSPMVKRSTFQCRLGVNYDNIASVKEKREEGHLPSENAGLPWGQWAIFPHLIEHKGDYYLRCTTLNNSFVPSVSYFQNGNEVTKEHAMLACLASEFKGKDDNEVFTIKIGSIVEVK